MKTITYNYYTFTSKTKIYAVIRSVSRSRKSKKISFFMMKNGELENITHVIAQCLGYKLDRIDFSIRVKGYGSFLVFETLNKFSTKIGLKNTPTWSIL